MATMNALLAVFVPKAARFWLLALLCAPALLVGQAASGRAEEAVMSAAPDADGAPEMDREQWLQRVEASRRRAQAFKLERRSHPAAAPPPIDRARIASDRVLRDDSLLPGDIVATSQGLFVFKGAHTDPQHPERDFIALPPR